MSISLRVQLVISTFSDNWSDMAHGNFRNLERGHNLLGDHGCEFEAIHCLIEEKIRD